MNFHSLTVEEVKRETQEAVSVLFRIPKHLVSNFKFIAGQYITIRTVVDGKEVRRDYSLCSSPNSEQLKVGIKAVENGVFSSYATTQLKKGDLLNVSEPQGRFTYQAVQSKHTIFCIAAGSGITPIMSILKEALETSESAEVALIYGNKSKNQTIFYDELLALKARYTNRFTIKFVFSQENVEDALFGRIDSSKIKFMLNNLDKVDLSYICGPEPMIMEAKETLLNSNVEASLIKFELFTPSKVEETSSEETNIEAGTAKITVLVDDEEATFTMPTSKTILEEALANDIDAPYSCQGGICSSCIARVTEGTVTMRQNNILTDSELEDGLILTCQAEPTSSFVRVDYDDV